jgi:hypothetical protein
MFMPLSLHPVPISNVHAPGFQVYRDPARTEPRYRAGLMGVKASLGRLAEAITEWDELAVASVLADMAACVGWKVSDFPGSRAILGFAASRFDDLKDAVCSCDTAAAREALAGMLWAMGQTPLRGDGTSTPRPARPLMMNGATG